MKRIFILALFLSVPIFAEAQTISDNSRVREAFELLDLWLDAQQAYDQIPGISVGIVHDQQLLWKKGFGFADRELQTPANSQTIYSICSISKLFTSVSIMQLRNQGKLGLDDPIEKHIPWFDIKQKYPESPSITLRSILTHSSGLPRESDYPYWTGPDFPFPKRDKIKEKLPEQETLYPAYTYFQYSNLGMTLLGEVIRQASGMDYSDYINKNILKELNLSDTKTFMPSEKLGKQLASGYGILTRKGVREKLPLFQANGIAAAAGFSSTVEDLAGFASWQFRLLNGGDDEIINMNTLKEMQRVHWLDPNWETTWGLGFSIWRNKDKTFVGHGGSCPGYRTQLLIQPNEKIATVFMANAMGVNSRRFAQTSYAIVSDAIKSALDSESEVKELNPEFRKFLGTYNEEPWGGESAVIAWKGELAIVSFPSTNPLDGMVKLKHIEGNRFRRIRKDDNLGETIVFETDSDGEIVRMLHHSNYSVKIK